MHNVSPDNDFHTFAVKLIEFHWATIEEEGHNTMLLRIYILKSSVKDIPHVPTNGLTRRCVRLCGRE